MVVDIHLPPASEDDEDESEVEKSATPVQSVVQPQQQPQRPFKHEVNRFQRCYSDGSQASPKRKGKVKTLKFYNLREKPTVNLRMNLRIFVKLRFILKVRES